MGETELDWAESLLTSPRLEDKLRRFEGTLLGGPARRVPALPARTEGLEVAAAGRGGLFPSDEALEDPRARGEALHFFANHELLAIELMAVALLRFPDAPEAFRRGLIRTLGEEQGHLSAYLARMRSLGVELGALPLAGYFWRAISGMARPLDYVAAMSLTFEQANLDYAQAYRIRFAALGDHETARVLQVVHDEEIRHVRHGVEWWTPLGGGVLDFERYQAALHPPLTPRRAKGLVFDRVARAAAGLGPAYVEALYAHHDSRADKPKLWLYRPEVEDRLGGRPTSKKAQAITEDLAPLLMFLAGPQDRVLLPQKPSVAHLAELRDLGFVLPELLGPKEARTKAHSSLACFGAPEPAELEGLSFETPPTPVPAELYDKRWAAAVLGDYVPGHPAAALPDWARPRMLQDLPALKALRTELAPHAPRMVVKAPFSASGRHRVQLPTEGPLPEHDQRMVDGLLATGPVRAEAWLDGVADLSVLLLVGNPVPVQGLSRFYTDARGQYAGHFLGPYGHSLSAEIHRALLGFNLEAEAERIGGFVARRLEAAGYQGPAGVDLLLYRDGPRLALHPLLEINPRYTMGHLARALVDRLKPGRCGRLRFIPKAEAHALGPTQARLSPHGRLDAGAVWLTDPSLAQAVVARLEIGAEYKHRLCQLPPPQAAGAQRATRA